MSDRLRLLVVLTSRRSQRSRKRHNSHQPEAVQK